MSSEIKDQESVVGETERVLSSTEEAEDRVSSAVMPTVPRESSELADQGLNNDHGEVTKSSEEVGQESVVGEGEGVLSTSEEAGDCAPSAVTHVAPLESGVPTEQIPDIEAQVKSLLANPEIETDDPEPKRIPFTEEMKKELRPLLQEGVRIAAEHNKQVLTAYLRRGEFLVKTRDKMKQMKLRAFRAVCAALGWGKTTAYDSIMLYKSYGEHLTDYDGVPEKKLRILASHPRAMDLLDSRWEEIKRLDDSELREWVREKKPSNVHQRKVKGITKIRVEPYFSLTWRRNGKTQIEELDESEVGQVVRLLEEIAKQRASKINGVSAAADTSAEIREFGEDTIEEACSDSEIGNVVVADGLPKPPDWRKHTTFKKMPDTEFSDVLEDLINDPALENDSYRIIGVKKKFYEPALLWGYFSNWIQENEKSRPDETDADFHLFIYRRSNGGAYWVHDSRLCWLEDAAGNHATPCDQDDLWKNRKDLSWVQAQIHWDGTDGPRTVVRDWYSFADFVEAILNNGMDEPDGGPMVKLLEEKANLIDLQALGVSNAADTSTDFANSRENRVEEACSDTKIENARGQSATNSADNEHLHVEEEEEEESQPSSQDASLDETGDYYASKPSQVFLIREFPGGREETDILVDGDIPDDEEWEDYADHLWNVAADEKKPFTRVRMKDPGGTIYLSELEY